MSQRENAGSNAPRFPVGAVDKDAAAPRVKPAPFPFPCFSFILARRASCFVGSHPTFIAWASDVGQPTSCAAIARSPVLLAGPPAVLPLRVSYPRSLRASCCSNVEPSYSVFGLGHPANVATVCKFSPPSPRVPAPVELFSLGGGHPVEPLPDVRRPDARSAQIGGPEGIAQCFQVSSYSGEPETPIIARNLLSKDRWRSALGDESNHLRPEVTFVLFAALFACARERLTGTGAGPDWPVIGPPGEPERVAPSADTGKHVDLGSSVKVRSFQVAYRPIVHFAERDVFVFDQLSQPPRGERVDLVVERDVHAAASRPIPGATICPSRNRNIRNAPPSALTSAAIASMPSSRSTDSTND